MPYTPSSPDSPRHVPLGSLRRLVAPFLEQGPVYVALGCGRVYVAHEPSQRCMRCGASHENHEIKELNDLNGLDKIDVYA